jgi:aspartate aminotransferase
MQGLVDLRESISKYIGKRNKTNFTSENIIIGPGTKELMFLLQLAFNGEIILPAPSWVSYEPQAIISENKVHWIETSSTNNWFPTAEQLEKKIKQTKSKNLLLFLNSPNNPAGTECKNLQEIAEISKKYNLIVLSDEIYLELTFQDKLNSISSFYPERTIISSGLSKWCGAGGWRLGFFAIPESLNEIKQSLKILSSESFSSVNAPTQYAAIEAYSGDHSAYLNNVRKILHQIGSYAYESLKSNKIQINKPEGGFYLFPEFNKARFASSEKMCENLLNQTGVALLPGSNFGLGKNKLVARLSYTDFDGNAFLNYTSGSKKLDNEDIKKYAPNIVEGISRIKEWSNLI